MSFGNCPKCHNEITLDEYNASLHTNIGDGGMCFKCIGVALTEIEQWKRVVVTHVDVIAEKDAEIAALQARIKELEGALGRILYFSNDTRREVMAKHDLYSHITDMAEAGNQKAISEAKP